MVENKPRRVGIINFVGKLDVSSGDVKISVRSNIASVGRHLLIDLNGLAEYPIPPSAQIDVEIKDNVLNEPNVSSFGAWGDIDRSRTLRVPLSQSFHARRTSITVTFVDPVTAAIIASAPQMHAPDETGDLKDTGESYIKFRRHADQTMPSKPIIDLEGPVIEFGSSGPQDVAESEQDVGFFHYGLPMAIGTFVTAMLLAEEGYDTPRWNKFKADAAQWAGFDDWKAMQTEFAAAEKPEIAPAMFANRTVGGLMNARLYKDKLKRMLSKPEAEQDMIIDEVKHAA